MFSTLLYLVAIASVLWSGGACTLSAGTAGKTTVTLDPDDPDPLITIPASTSMWNDIHFELQGSGSLDKGNTKVEDTSGGDQGWNDPVQQGSSKKYDMEKGSGTAIAANTAAQLQLQATGSSGWSNCVYSRTQDGSTIYGSHLMVHAPPVPVRTFYVETGNEFPVMKKALIELKNNGLDDVASLTFSVDSNQEIDNIGSSQSGTFNDSLDQFTFDDPVEPSETITLWWEYDDYSSTPSTDTTVTVTLTIAP